MLNYGLIRRFNKWYDNLSEPTRTFCFFGLMSTWYIPYVLASVLSNLMWLDISIASLMCLMALALTRI